MMNGHVITGRDTGGGNMPETKLDMSHSVLENAFLELVRQAVRTEVQELLDRRSAFDNRPSGATIICL